MKKGFLRGLIAGGIVGILGGLAIPFLSPQSRLGAAFYYVELFWDTMGMVGEACLVGAVGGGVAGAVVGIAVRKKSVGFQKVLEIFAGVVVGMAGTVLVTAGDTSYYWQCVVGLAVVVSMIVIGLVGLVVPVAVVRNAGKKRERLKNRVWAGVVGGFIAGLAFAVVGVCFLMFMIRNWSFYWWDEGDDCGLCGLITQYGVIG